MYQEMLLERTNTSVLPGGSQQGAAYRMSTPDCKKQTSSVSEEQQELYEDVRTI